MPPDILWKLARSDNRFFEWTDATQPVQRNACAKRDSGGFSGLKLWLYEKNSGGSNI